MGSKLQKNAIITGYINSYCLVCECYFETTEATCAHMDEDTHSDKLLAHPYLEKYNSNHIRKVNKGYFCEFCSLLLATAAKVSLHVQEKSHYEKKGSFLLRRLSGISAVIAFDDILINDKAWHSLADDTCAICNEEFDNEGIHKTMSGHLLRLVQSKVLFGADNNVYRKTDESSFQCLTCNCVYLMTTLNEHFNDADHKKLYAQCQQELKKYNEETKTKNLPAIPTKTSKDKKNEKNEKKLLDKNHNNIAEKNSKEPKQEAAKTKECKETALGSGNKTVPEDDATVYANENNLTYNAGNTNAFCRICETKLPATVRSMKEHVNGKEHKSKLAKASQVALAAKSKPMITKRPTIKFVTDFVNVENLVTQDVVLNGKICVPLACFFTVTRNGSKHRCQICEVNMYQDEIIAHTETTRHERAAQDTPVITSLPDTEFVREVREGIYHCGYCNLIMPRWDDVGSHLQSREHKENKDASAWRLQRHLPVIGEHRRRQEAEVIRMLVMGHMYR